MHSFPNVNLSKNVFPEIIKHCKVTRNVMGIAASRHDCLEMTISDNTAAERGKFSTFDKDGKVMFTGRYVKQ